MSGQEKKPPPANVLKLIAEALLRKEAKKPKSDAKLMKHLHRRKDDNK